jgi:hypothetical protein
MSDVTVAPAATPTAPPASEVPVNESPVSAPAPISNQPPPAPEKAPTAQERAVGRRESIERGFKRAEAAQDEKLGQRQRPGMGHNQPPSPMEKDQAPPRERGEHGHFAARQAEPGQPGQPGQQQPAQPRSQYAPLPETAPYREPPARFKADPIAAADWHGAPESVRAAVTRTTKEMEQGIQHYRAAAEAFNEIADYHELASKHGTTLRTALSNYVGMETKLREDLIGGLDLIVNNLGLVAQTENGPHKINLRDVAYHILNMTPEQHKLAVQANQTSAQQMQMGQLHQTVERLANTVGQMQYDATYGRTLSAVDQFAEQHPRFDELSDVIKYELNFGFSLDEAYARADRLYPAAGTNGGTHAAQTRNATAQTRQVDRSISGAPNAGLASRPRNGPPPTRREALESAFKRANGSL